MQQDRGWIFSRTARTVEVSIISKFSIIWHCTFVKMEKRSGEGKVGKVQSPNICKIVKNVLLVSKTTLQHFLYRMLTQFG
jgi:hypothetical protein